MFFFVFFLQKVLSNATVLNLNVFEHQKKYIKKIFEGSCDNENSALPSQE